MRRREWLRLAGGAGMAALGAGCGATDDAVRLNLPAAERQGGDGYGVWHGRHLVAGRNLNLRQESFSITKTLAALAVVRAAGEGWLELDQALGEVIPEWRADPRKSRVTVRMLVDQSAGFPSGEAALYRGRIRDKGRVALALPLVDPPGSCFRYGPASSEILAEVLRRKLRTHGKSTEELLGTVMHHIGMVSPDWRKDEGGQFYLSTGGQFSVAELGRLGQTVARLARGDHAAGLRAEVFQDLAAARPANPMVAAGIWWNRNASQPGARSIEPERHLDQVHPPSFWRLACLGADVDPGWLAMVGSGGKRVYVLPSRELVVARLGHAAGWNDGAFLRALNVA